jgi:hypothetical protein
MIELEQLKILAKLVDNIEAITVKLEESYNNNNGEEFNKYKQQILETQKNISEILQ